MLLVKNGQKKFFQLQSIITIKEFSTIYPIIVQRKEMKNKSSLLQIKEVEEEEVLKHGLVFCLYHLYICYQCQYFKTVIDLLQVTGLGQSHGLGVSNSNISQPQQQPLPPVDEQKSSVSSSGSDILDTSSHNLRLDKSNILMLGPTGSGTGKINHQFITLTQSMHSNKM